MLNSQRRHDMNKTRLLTLSVAIAMLSVGILIGTLATGTAAAQGSNPVGTYQIQASGVSDHVYRVDTRDGTVERVRPMSVPAGKQPGVWYPVTE
jgi:hypothetical protein